MPDCHAFCKDMEQSKEEFMKRLELSKSVIEEIGLSLSDDLEMAIRFTEDFYINNKDFIKQVCLKIKKPILVEMWKERFFYFVLSGNLIIWIIWEKLLPYPQTKSILKMDCVTELHLWMRMAINKIQ